MPLVGGFEDDLSASISPEERLAMMWPPACEAWATMGRPIPEHPRTQAPVRVVRGSRAAGRLKDQADLEVLGEQ